MMRGLVSATSALAMTRGERLGGKPPGETVPAGAGTAVPAGAGTAAARACGTRVTRRLRPGPLPDPRRRPGRGAGRGRTLGCRLAGLDLALDGGLAVGGDVGVQYRFGRVRRLPAGHQVSASATAR